MTWDHAASACQVVNSNCYASRECSFLKLIAMHLSLSWMSPPLRSTRRRRGAGSSSWWSLSDAGTKLLLNATIASNIAYRAKREEEKAKYGIVGNEEDEEDMVSDGRAPVTVIASTHNLTLIDNFTHAAVLHNGNVVELGEIPVLEKQKGPFRYKPGRPA